ncbi:hypothetical protein ACFOGG_11515 [Brenneria rubrifaciens]|uniref:hypothetical protein n=1 Tax=Brenneria rubrifaciens TaxID=55213 RepID=UPI003607DB45
MRINERSGNRRRNPYYTRHTYAYDGYQGSQSCFVASQMNMNIAGHILNWQKRSRVTNKCMKFSLLTQKDNTTSTSSKSACAGTSEKRSPISR